MTKKCRHCGSHHTNKNGIKVSWKAGKKYRVQRHLCQDCGRSTMGDRV